MTQSLDAIRAALKPFAEEAKRWNPSNGWSKPDPALDPCSIGHNDLRVRDLRRAAEAYASLSDQGAGDGWKMVPVEPSKDLQWIGFNAAFPGEQATDKKMRIVATSFRAMLAAAPASHIPVDRRAVLEEAAIYFRRKQGDYTGLEIAEAIRALAASPSLANEKEGEAASTDKPNILNDVTSEWDTVREEGQVTVHHRMIDGVLCRWWGERTPGGVAIIDAAARLSPAPASKGPMEAPPECWPGCDDPDCPYTHT